MNTTRRKRSVLGMISVLFLILVMAGPGAAEVPKKLNYQGYLTDSSGDPVTGTIPMTFAIYEVDTEGAALWSETQNVTVTHGRYSVHLGTISPIDLAEAEPYYLGVTLDGEEMMPREELTSVLYALFVEDVETDATNTFVGRNAGQANTSSGSSNTFVGRDAGLANTGDGEANTFVGKDAGQENLTGDHNTYVGRGAGHDATGSENVFLGYAAGHYNTTGTGNVFLGYRSGQNEPGSNMLYIANSDTDTPLIYGDFTTDLVKIHGDFEVTGNISAENLDVEMDATNTFFGRNAGSDTTGQYNTFVGAEAGPVNTTGTRNTFIGWGTGQANTTGEFNTIVGHKAGYENTGTNNTFLGTYAGLANTSGSDNTFLGRDTGRANETGNGNVFLGVRAGYHEIGSNKLYIANTDTTDPLIYGEFDNDLVRINGDLEVPGRLSLSNESKNVFVGHEAGNETTETGRNNTFIGHEAGAQNTTGQGNTFIGSKAGYFNTTGNQNIFIGPHSGWNSGWNEDDVYKLYIGIGSFTLIYGEFDTGLVEVPILRIKGGSDIAEPFEISGTAIESGMVVAIDPQRPGNLRIAEMGYDRTVAGIISGAGGLQPGLTLQQESSLADDVHPVAMNGRVYCWTDASYGPIEPGDLLTTSNTPGHAMKVTDYEKAQGAIIGKAMTGLEHGKDLVLVLVTLQ